MVDQWRRGKYSEDDSADLDAILQELEKHYCVLVIKLRKENKILYRTV